MKEDSTKETLLHIKRVNELLLSASTELINRAKVHDDSKLKSPEKELFDEFTPKLKECTYTGFVANVFKTIKYPFKGKDGSMKRCERIDGKAVYINAEDEGCVGNEKMLQVEIIISGGSISINELDNVESFNISVIDDIHPLFDKKIAKSNYFFKLLNLMLNK